MNQFAEFDTGAPSYDAIDAIPDWFRDLLPQDVARADLFHAYGLHIMGEINAPKKMETVRKHVLAKWSLLRELAEIHPKLFDEILAAYAERWLTVE